MRKIVANLGPKKLLYWWQIWCPIYASNMTLFAHVFLVVYSQKMEHKNTPLIDFW